MFFVVRTSPAYIGFDNSKIFFFKHSLLLAVHFPDFVNHIHPYQIQNKNEQIITLIELNDELENYFRNTIIPQLFVDAHLILRKFTPPAMKQFNLAVTDVSRPIDEIKDNFRFPVIIDNIRHLIAEHEMLLETISHDIKTPLTVLVLLYRCSKEFLKREWKGSLYYWRR